MLKAAKVRIYPTKEQEKFLNQQFGAVRFVYNKSLWIIKHQYKNNGKRLYAKKDIKPLLSKAKKSRKYNWIKEYDSIALQQSCINLNKAFSSFFKKQSGYPNFKKKHSKQSSYHCTSIKYGDNWIKIPKLNSTIKAKIHRPLTGQLKSITLSKTNTNKYYASILIDTPDICKAPSASINANKVIGVDVGIKSLLNYSTGDKLDNPKYLLQAEQNLRRKQKSLSRKVKGSNSRAKARLLLAKCHERVAFCRHDFQHKLTKTLVDKNQAIIVETLKVKNMMKNHKLAKHIADASWHKLTEKLEYKAKQSGKRLVKIDQWFASSKTCSCCSFKKDKLSLSVRSWDCPECNTHHDRDINAAINIKKQGILKLKAEGLSVSANGGLRKTDYLSAVA
jgi:putative transposase